MQAQGCDRVLRGCLELHPALPVHADAHDRVHVSVQSVSTLSVWRARPLRVEHSGPLSVKDLQHGRLSALPVVLCDATQVLCLAETVCMDTLDRGVLHVSEDWDCHSVGGS